MACIQETTLDCTLHLSFSHRSVSQNESLRNATKTNVRGAAEEVDDIVGGDEVGDDDVGDDDHVGNNDDGNVGDDDDDVGDDQDFGDYDDVGDDDDVGDSDVGDDDDIGGGGGGYQLLLGRIRKFTNVANGLREGLEEQSHRCRNNSLKKV